MVFEIHFVFKIKFDFQSFNCLENTDCRRVDFNKKISTVSSITAELQIITTFIAISSLSSSLIGLLPAVRWGLDTKKTDTLQTIVTPLSAHAAQRIKSAEVACDNEMDINQNLCLFVFVQLSLAANNTIPTSSCNIREAIL